MSSDASFTKENLDYYLKELGKEFRRLNGKTMSAEIILVGGAAILVNYGFREMTYDMDAIIEASSVMKEAINKVGDKFGLPNGWLNTDFKKTKSYTPKLIAISEYYMTVSNILTIRTISSEYLVAMKLMAGRKYKNDLSDIIGILREHQRKGAPITRERLDKAVCDLYDGWDDISSDSMDFIESALADTNYEVLFELYREEEKLSEEALIEFTEQYPKKLNNDNIDAILKEIKRKKDLENHR